MTSTAPPRAPQVPGDEPGESAAQVPQDERGQRSGLKWLLELPGNAVRSIKSSSAATPGRLSLIATGLVVLSLVAGVVGAVSAQERANTIDSLLEQREPLAAAAQQVYRSLSDADATAASAFLATGVEPPELRERYDLDIAQAGAALSRAAADSASVPEAVTQVNILSQNVPRYTGLLEKARASNRQGFPVGAAYLREASELMRSTILPAAHRLYEIDTERLVEAQDDATNIPWLTALLALGLLAALIAAQIYLRRRTNRVFNIGLLVATIAMGVAVLWTAGALTVQSVFVSSGSNDGSQQVDLLVRARIAALQARADETLTLVARGSGEEYEEEFKQVMSQFAGKDGTGGLLGQARDGAPEGEAASQVDAVMRSAATWIKAHAQVRELDDSGDYEQAVEVAISTQNDDSAASSFTKLDRDLAAAIKTGRQSFVDETTNGSRALTLLAPGFGLLAVVAALGVTLGIRERLREYR